MTSLRTLPPVSGSRIASVAGYRPAGRLGNAELAAMVDTDDAWIRQRTGIVTRQVAGPDETVADMGTEAAAKALAAAGVEPAEVDLVLGATCSMADRLPALAPVVAGRIGIPGPGATDLQAACAGFCYALAVADQAVRTGTAGTVLVVAAEKLTELTDYRDRSTCILFGDGAGAAVVTGADAAGIGPVAWGSAGDAWDAITCTRADPYLRQDGQRVFRWATYRLAPVALRACALAGVSPADLDVVVPHQANLRIVDGLVRQIGARPDIVVGRDVADAGNTSAASVPLALSRLTEEGLARAGDVTLLLGFGAGLTYAGQVVICP